MLNSGPNAKNGGGGEGKGKALEFHAHNVKELRMDRIFFREVIQKPGISLSNVPKPMFSEKEQECCKFVYTG